jgi:GNAT superfamily N-acetyltransferase
MPLIRVAVPDDLPEVIRLAKLLWGDMDLPVQAGDWERNAIQFLIESLRNDTVRVSVVDDPNIPGRLIATGVGVTHAMTPSYWLANGKMGYVQWFYTAPEYRRQGLAGAILDDLIAWFTANEVTRVQLHSAPDAISIYRAKGFEPTMFDNYWLRIPI